MDISSSRKAFAASASLLFLLTLAPPASATSHMTDPILVQQIPIDVLHPIAGSNYRIANQCANALDGQCVYLNPNGWVRYQLTLDGYGATGIDFLTRYIRGQSWAQSCTWHLVGPGTDETDIGCPSSPNTPEESSNTFWFDEGYPPGTYTLEFRCDVGCNYAWIGSLEVRAYYHGLRIWVWEHEHDYFPRPGQIGLPTIDPQGEACVVLKFQGSNWYRSVDYTLDWGDDSAPVRGRATLQREWHDWRPIWAASFCHSYEFPLNAYQVCASGTDGLGRTVSHCITVSGGLNAEQLVNEGVAYVAGTVGV